MEIKITAEDIAKVFEEKAKEIREAIKATWGIPALEGEAKAEELEKLAEILRY